MLVCAVDVLTHVRYTRVSDVFRTSFDEMFTGYGVACIRGDGARAKRSRATFVQSKSLKGLG